MKRLLVLAPLLCLATGFGECDAFSDVVIPATDTAAPAYFAGVWTDGHYVATDYGNQPLFATIAPTPAKAVFLVSAGIDAGGLHRISMSGTYRYLCCPKAESYCLFSNSNDYRVDYRQGALTPHADTQPGDLGETVSNGDWVAHPVTLPPCSPSRPFRIYQASWTTTAEDFYGNKVTSKPSTVQSVGYVTP